MAWNEDEGLVMDDIKKILAEMPEVTIPKKQAVMPDNAKENTEIVSIQTLVQFIKVYSKKRENGTEYYVEEGELYSLGDRKIAKNAKSNSLLPVDINWLDKLIELYEAKNHDIKIEKKYIDLDIKRDYTLEELITNELTDKINDFLKNNNNTLSKEDIDLIVNDYFNNIDLQQIEDSLIEKYKDSIIKGNSFKQ